jgi:hypothetical protein
LSFDYKLQPKRIHKIDSKLAIFTQNATMSRQKNQNIDYREKRHFSPLKIGKNCNHSIDPERS